MVDVTFRCNEVCGTDPEYSKTGSCSQFCNAQPGEVEGGYCCLNDENSAENYCSSDRLKKYAFPDNKLHYCTTAISIKGKFYKTGNFSKNRNRQSIAN